MSPFCLTDHDYCCDLVILTNLQSTLLKYVTTGIDNRLISPAWVWSPEVAKAASGRGEGEMGASLGVIPHA